MDALQRQMAYPAGETFKFIWQHQLNIWVYRCVRVIAQAGLRPEPRIYAEYVDGGVRKQRALPDEHPAMQLFLNPNERDTMRDVLEQLWISWQLTGMWFFYHDRKTNTLEHLRSDRMEILPADGKRLIGGYKYTVDGRTIEFPVEDIIYERHYNPTDDFYGLSPLKAAANSINAHLKATKMNLVFFDNACMPLGFFTTAYNFANDKAIGEQIKSELQDICGGYEKFGETIVAGGDVKWQSIQPTHTEMAFIQLLDQARDEIGTAFGVPEIFLNVREGMNYANAREHERLLWRATMIPQFLKIEAAFDKFLNRRFGSKGERLRMKFDLRQIEALHEDAVQEAEASRVLVSSFQRTVNEARASRGEAPVEGGDVLMGPMSFVRLDQIGDVIDQRAPQVSLAASRPGMRHKRVKSLLITPDARLAHWIETKDIIVRGEGRMRRLIVAIADDWKRYCLDRLGVKAAGPQRPEDIIFDLDEARAMLINLARPILEDTANTGGKRVMRLVEAGTSWNLRDPRVEMLLRLREQRFAEHIGDANWERLRASLADGISAGENARQLADRVEDEIGRIISNAQTIARTEVLPCYHEGQVEGMRQSGVVEEKEWLAAFIERSREEHIAADGQIVPLDSTFSVWGEELRHPGDSNGRAENIINCLCDVLPVINVEE